MMPRRDFRPTPGRTLTITTAFLQGPSSIAHCAARLQHFDFSRLRQSAFANRQRVAWQYLHSHTGAKLLYQRQTFPVMHRNGDLRFKLSQNLASEFRIHRSPAADGCERHIDLAEGFNLLIV